MPHLFIGTLGPLVITLDGQTITGLAYDKVWALLVYLVQMPEHPHRRERLAGLLWPDQSEEGARTNLRQALARLRKALGDGVEASGDPCATPAHLLTNRTEVQFNAASAHTLDVSEFASLLSSCATHAHRQAESCPVCAERRERAVALYRGPFLDKFYISDSDLFEEWVALVREPLHQHTLDALAALVVYHERHGNYQQALHYGERQLELDPWREEAYRQIMRLLALNGQRSAALHCYDRCRTMLEVELGVTPAAETIALYEKIHAVEFDGVTKTDYLSFPTKRRHNLPLQPTPFLGREEERAALADLIADPTIRLITLQGPGGTGKTRLALQAASEAGEAFVDGTFFVNLAPLNTAQHIIHAVAKSLDFALANHADPLTELQHYLRARELLLVLDNYEHLLAPAARDPHTNGNGNSVAIATLTAILQHAPGVNMLVTSRERLNLQGEWVVDVGGLTIPAEPWPARTEQVEAVETYSAVGLFLQTARRVLQDFTPTAADHAAIVRICQLVQGMPLALELAAAWVRVLSCHEIADEIAQSLGFLTTNLRDLPERHRSLQAVFDHSWTLLSGEEQHVFAACSIFRGGFTRHAATEIAGASLATLAALVDKSLLRRDLNGRYEVHELARQYAATQLIDAQAETQTRTRHLTFYMHFAEEAEPRMTSGAQAAQWHARVALEHDNLRTALDWSSDGGEFEAGLRIVSALWQFWMNRGHAPEGQHQAERFLARPEAAAPTLLRATVLHTAGVCAYYQGRFADALPRLREGAAIGAELGTSGRHILAKALISLAYTVYAQSYDLDRVQALGEEILALGQALEDAYILGHAWFHLSTVAWQRGDYEHIHYRKSLPYFQAESGSYVMSGNVLRQLGIIHHEQGDYLAAQDHFRQGLAVFEELGDRTRISRLLGDLGHLALAQEHIQEAEGFFERALILIRETGHLTNQLFSLDSLSRLLQRKGDFVRAYMLLQEAVAVNVEMDHSGWMARILDAFACLAVRQRQAAMAAQLYGAAQAHFAPLSGHYDKAWQLEHEQLLATVRAQLGEVAFATAWADGAAMTLDEAVALAEAQRHI